ncbi:MAG: hypothetical protein QXM16_06590 [Nitrososphaerota archaeon]
MSYIYVEMVCETVNREKAQDATQFRFPYPLALKVDSPRTVEAVYTIEPDLPTTGIAISLIAASPTTYQSSPSRKEPTKHRVQG